MEHDDYVAEFMDDVSVEVFRIIEIDNPYRKDTTESVLVDVESNRSRPSMGLLPLVHVIGSSCVI